MTASMPPAPGASVSALLETATQLFRATLLKCLPLAMLAVLFAQLPNIYWIATGHQLSLRVPQDSTYEGLAAFGWVVEVLLFAAMMLRQRAVIAGTGVDVTRELRLALQRLPILLLTLLLAGLSVAAGMLLLVVPGIFLMVCYVVVLPLSLFEDAGPYRALVRAVQLMRPWWWKALAALVIAVLVVFICALVFAAFIGVFAALLAGEGPAFQALETASSVGLIAVVFVFFSSLVLVFHSAASNSA